MWYLRALKFLKSRHYKKCSVIFILAHIIAISSPKICYSKDSKKNRLNHEYYEDFYSEHLYDNQYYQNVLIDQNNYSASKGYQEEGVSKTNNQDDTKTQQPKNNQKTQDNKTVKNINKQAPIQKSNSEQLNQQFAPVVVINDNNGGGDNGGGGEKPKNYCDDKTQVQANALNAAIAANPKNAANYYSLGLVYYCLGKPKLASITVAKAHYVDPNYAKSNTAEIDIAEITRAIDSNYKSYLQNGETVNSMLDRLASRQSNYDNLQDSGNGIANNGKELIKTLTHNNQTLKDSVSDVQKIYHIDPNEKYKPLNFEEEVNNLFPYPVDEKELKKYLSDMYGSDFANEAWQKDDVYNN